MTETAKLCRIALTYEDGERTTFEKQPTGEWHLLTQAVRVTGYDPANVMRVVGNGVGHRV